MNHFQEAFNAGKVLLKARTAAKELHGRDYEEKVAFYKEKIEITAKEMALEHQPDFSTEDMQLNLSQNKFYLEAAGKLANEFKQVDGTGYGITMLFAAAADLIEEKQ